MPQFEVPHPGRQPDAAVLALALSERYSQRFYSLLTLKGVGTLTAMVFLTEIGVLQRFAQDFLASSKAG